MDVLLLALGWFAVIMPIGFALAFRRTPKAVRWFLAAIPLSLVVTYLLVEWVMSIEGWVGAGDVIPPVANVVLVPGCLIGVGGLVVLGYGVLRRSASIAVSGGVAILAAFVEVAIAGLSIALASIS